VIEREPGNYGLIFRRGGVQLEPNGKIYPFKTAHQQREVFDQVNTYICSLENRVQFMGRLLDAYQRAAQQEPPQ
jgi:hypothetical protein